MTLIAHRGFADIAPENTMVAVEQAASQADAVEIDVRRCGSGELVACHDPTVDRVTAASGPLAEYTSSELRALTVKDSSEPIPTIHEILAHAPSDARFLFELKEPGLASDLVELLGASDQETAILSFLPGELRTVRKIAPELERGLLINRSIASPIQRASELGCRSVGAHSWRCLCTRLIDRAHQADLDVFAWGVKRPIHASILSKRGVTAIAADRPLPLHQ